MWLNRFIILILLTFTLNANECKRELFNISTKEEITLYELINQIALQCNFTIIVKDRVAVNLLNQKVNHVYLKDVTFFEMLDYLIKERELSYEFTGNLIKIKYLITKTFKIDYVNTTRGGESNTNVQLSGGASSSGGSGGGSNTATQSGGSGGGSGGGSQISEVGSKINATDKFDFWQSLKDDITYLLSTTYTLENFDNIQNLIISREAGLITVSGNIEQMKKVEEYIKKLQKRLQNQVLIDVKILSIDLDDEQRTGIDWNKLLDSINIGYNLEKTKNSGKSIGNSNLNSLSKSNDYSKSQSDTVSNDLLSPTYNSNDDSLNSNTLSNTNSLTNDIVQSLDYGSGSLFTLSGSVKISDIINILKQNGKVKSISNPKVLTLNNQPALISSGDEFFYRTSQSSVVAGDTTTQSSSENIESIFTGVLLDITPAISDDNTIILKINPSISSPISYLSDDNNNRRMPPDISRKQISSVIKVKDGDRLILGGLITSSNDMEEKKVPLLGDLPLFGNMFRHTRKTQKLSELVIIITPHILRDTKSLTLKDLEYKRLSNE